MGLPRDDTNKRLEDSMKNITIINNIDKVEVNDTLLSELLLEMGMQLGLDLDKPVTSIVSILSCEDEKESEFAKMFKKKS